MTLAYTYDGAAFAYAIAPTSLNLASGAEMGAPVFGGLTPEDPTAALTMKGHRPFVVTESACSQPRLFTGWTTERASGRSYEAGQFVGADARAHDVTIVDLNALFGFRLISGADGNRPAETFAARIAWILGSDYLTGLIADTGYITSTEATYTVGEADYRDGYPAAVMSDLMDRTDGWYNYFAFWDPVAAAVGLWVGQLDDAVSDSTLRVSNVPADWDGSTTFAPDSEAKVVVSPTDTYSEVTVRYSHGTQRLFRSRASTATNYIRRGTTIDRPYTGAAATASNQAERFLDQHANEQDRINVTIIVPAAAAGLAVAGQRMDVKFSHLTGYTSFSSMRIVGTSLTPTDDTAAFYALSLELAAPRPVTSPASAVQSAFGGYGGSPQGYALPTLPTVGNVLLFLCDQRNPGVVTPDPATWTVIQNNYGTGGIVALVKVADGVRVGGPPATDLELTGMGTTQWGMWELADVDLATLVSAVSAGDATANMSISVIPEAAGSAFEAALFTTREGDDGVGEPPTTATPGTGWTQRLVTNDIYFPGALIEDRTITDPDGTDAYPATGTRVKSGTWVEHPWAGNWTGIVVALSSTPDIEIDLPTPPAVTAIIDQINNLEYLGDIPLGLPEL